MFVPPHVSLHLNYLQVNVSLTPHLTDVVHVFEDYSLNDPLPTYDYTADVGQTNCYGDDTALMCRYAPANAVRNIANYLTGIRAYHII